MNEHSHFNFPPTSAKELKATGIEQLDVIIVTGDAYIDHPSFGPAVLVRLLQSQGFTVGVIPQPNWRDDGRDFLKLGQPKYFFGISAGCMDSMVNHYTAARRLRSDDAYTPGGKAGQRPDYPTIVYTQMLKRFFPDTPVVIGGIEASLRRVTHYDYWQDKLLPSMLAMSGADLLVYGMGEKPLLELMDLLQRGVAFSRINTVPQTALLIDSESALPKNKKWEDHYLNSHQECLDDKLKYALNFKRIEIESNRFQSKMRLLQKIDDKLLVINPPFAPMSEKEIDASFDLPYTRSPHPRYAKKEAIPAFAMIANSVNMHRGCFGGCSFCTISAHQGKFIASRSPKSILAEVKSMSESPAFNGVISDLGGPSANMYRMKGKDQQFCDTCARASCIYPNICSNLDTSHRPLVELYRQVRAIPKVKHVFIGSGIRYDLFMAKPDTSGRGYGEYFEEVVAHHVSGRLKVAPEHSSPRVLAMMRKPSFDMYVRLKAEFERICKKYQLNQEIIPYFISSHPKCEESDMADLAIRTGELGHQLKQVQDFTPTPMTLSTVIYYSGIDPYSLEEIYTARQPEEKKKQRQFFFWYLPENAEWVKKRFRALNLWERAKALFGH